MLDIVSPTTIEEFAATCGAHRTVYFAIGTGGDHVLLMSASSRLQNGEWLVLLDEAAGCVHEMAAPERLPAIGAWSSKGTIVGYEYTPDAIDSLMFEARKFS